MEEKLLYNGIAKLKARLGVRWSNRSTETCFGECEQAGEQYGAATKSKRHARENCIKLGYELFLMAQFKTQDSKVRSWLAENGMRFKEKTHLLVLIMRWLTGGKSDNRDLASRWAAVAELAAQQAIEPAHLGNFIRRNGGIEGCVERIRAQRDATRPQSVRKKAPPLGGFRCSAGPNVSKRLTAFFHAGKKQNVILRARLYPGGKMKLLRIRRRKAS